MDEPTTIFVGLDVHRDTVAVATAEGGRDGEVRFLGVIQPTAAALDKLAKRLRASDGATRLCFCYEAGPFGYAIYRHLTAQGHDCIVVAPSRIPRRPGDKIKNDRRDATMLATLHRAGELTAVWVPDETHEGIRDLIRARLAAVAALRAARQQLSSFLLRHNRRYLPNRKNWTRAHHLWLAAQRFDGLAQGVAYQDYVEAVVTAQARRDRLTKQIEGLVPGWSFAPLVPALRALRGLDLISAVTFLASIGDLSRFAAPRQLMAYLGLIPSEHSSGTRRRQGGITKTGDPHARRMLIEAAWCYRYPPRVSTGKAATVAAAPKAARDIAWKAQVRLCTRYRAMVSTGKPSQLVTTAIARELAGFVWAIGREVAPAGEVYAMSA